MLLIPIDGEETPISITDRAQAEALIGSTNLTQIGVSGGKVLVFSDESPLERDGEIFYPQRNTRASKLRGRRVTGIAILGTPHEFDFDKYEAVETMECIRCRQVVEMCEDCPLCESCLQERKRAGGVWTMGLTLFVTGWILGFGLRGSPLATQPAEASPVLAAPQAIQATVPQVVPTATPPALPGTTAPSASPQPSLTPAPAPVIRPVIREVRTDDAGTRRLPAGDLAGGGGRMESALPARQVTGASRGPFTVMVGRDGQPVR